MPIEVLREVQRSKALPSPEIAPLQALRRPSFTETLTPDIIDPEHQPIIIPETRMAVIIREPVLRASGRLFSRENQLSWQRTRRSRGRRGSSSRWRNRRCEECSRGMNNSSRRTMHNCIIMAVFSFAPTTL